MMSAARDSRRCFTGGTRRTQSIRDAETLPVDEEEQPDDEMFQDSRSARLIKTDKEECQSNEMSYPIWRTASRANRLQRFSQTPAAFKRIKRTTGWQCENLLLSGVGLDAVRCGDTAGCVLPPTEGFLFHKTAQRNRIKRRFEIYLRFSEKRPGFRPTFLFISLSL